MPGNLKEIRRRIGSVKSTQKITRAMKMVAGARFLKAQQRIVELRPYAVKTGEVLGAVVAKAVEGDGVAPDHPLLAQRSEESVLLLIVSSDRGLCGPFNANINRAGEHEWRDRERDGQRIQIATIGRKGRDYFKRRSAPIFHDFDGVWDQLDMEQARAVARTILRPFVAGSVDSIYLVYNEFKSAMAQQVVLEPLLPVARAAREAKKLKKLADAAGVAGEELPEDFIFEPRKGALLNRLVPMYIEITILRALYESMASELGARMTAMDAATKNASEMISTLTLQYNRARQAAITTELMEIIGGAEALSE